MTDVSDALPAPSAPATEEHDALADEDPRRMVIYMKEYFPHNYRHDPHEDQSELIHSHLRTLSRRHLRTLLLDDDYRSYFFYYFSRHYYLHHLFPWLLSIFSQDFAVKLELFDALADRAEPDAMRQIDDAINALHAHLCSLPDDTQEFTD